MGTNVNITTQRNASDSARLDHMRLVTEILTLLKGHGITTAQVRHINAVIAAANQICDEFGRPDQIAAPGSGLIAWACSDGVGMSSVFMARRLSAHAGLRFPGHRIRMSPRIHDPDDFGRCLGLLEAVPELREHVPKMAEHGKVWTAYVAHWAEMEALYQEEFRLGRAPKLAALMKRLQESA